MPSYHGQQVQLFHYHLVTNPTIALGMAMLVGRFAMIVPMLALGGFLADRYLGTRKAVAFGALLLVAGGVLYSTGVIFYVNKRLKFARAIWHGHVVAAAAARLDDVANWIPARVTAALTGVLWRLAFDGFSWYIASNSRLAFIQFFTALKLRDDRVRLMSAVLNVRLCLISSVGFSFRPPSPF